MFGKVKQWLGIEGVKLELVVPEVVDKSSGRVEGKIRLTSMNEQKADRIIVKMVEKYTRGRKEDRMTDEYELGQIVLNQLIEVPAQQAIEIDFELPFELSKSEMDEMGDKNILFGGLVKAAKWMNGVDSEYRLEAEANVLGTALNPFDKKVIQFL